jgi:hypothetical protein
MATLKLTQKETTERVSDDMCLLITQTEETDAGEMTALRRIAAELLFASMAGLTIRDGKICTIWEDGTNE